MYTYLTPIYFRPGYTVLKEGARSASSITVCFVLDSKTGCILTWSCSLGYPEVDLYARALLLLRHFCLSSAQPSGDGYDRGSFYNSLLTPRVQIKRIVEKDKHLPALKWKTAPRKLTMLNERIFLDCFLRNLYEWPFEIRNTIENPYSLNESLFKRLITDSINRTNDEWRNEESTQKIN